MNIAPFSKNSSPKFIQLDSLYCLCFGGVSELSPNQTVNEVESRLTSIMWFRLTLPLPHPNVPCTLVT